MRLFLDANVLFTASYSPEGNSAALFELTRAGHCELITSQLANEEAFRNLTLKRPAGDGGFQELRGQLRLCREASRNAQEWAEDHGLPAKDVPILAAATESGADLLVTGDQKYFGHLLGKRLGDLRVVTPVEALRTVLRTLKISRTSR